MIMAAKISQPCLPQMPKTLFRIIKLSLTLFLFWLRLHCRVNAVTGTLQRRVKSIHSQLPRSSREVRLHLRPSSKYSGTEEWQPPFDNPPFFPCSSFDLARDAAFSVEVALISKLTRVRLDVRSRFLSTNEQLEWVMLLAGLLCGGKERSNDGAAASAFRRVHVFVDKQFTASGVARAVEKVGSYQSTANMTDFDGGGCEHPALEADGVAGSWDAAAENVRAGVATASLLHHHHDHPFFEAVAAGRRSGLARSRSARSRKSKAGSPRDHLCIIFNPNNMRLHARTLNEDARLVDSSLIEPQLQPQPQQDEHAAVVDDVQSVCFQAALCGVPVLLVNPGE